MKPWASDKYAFGFCDRCGLRYDLADLRQQIVNRVVTDLRVCPECMDIDHEQYGLDRIDATDNFNLRFARPDTSQTAARSLFGFNPVLGMTINLQSGTPHVRITDA